jgi:hypothetical protein
MQQCLTLCRDGCCDNVGRMCGPRSQRTSTTRRVRIDAVSHRLERALPVNSPGYCSCARPQQRLTLYSVVTCAGPPLKVPLTTLMAHHSDTWRAIQVCCIELQHASAVLVELSGVDLSACKRFARCSLLYLHNQMECASLK